MAQPEIGAPAPAFAGPTQDGSSISLSGFKGKKVALYFYPRDNTSGCTTQACNLRDNFDSLEDAGIVIVGVSDDPVASHHKFASKFELPFPLLADTDKAALEAYGVWVEKNMYGRKYMGTKRTTFLIDEAGILRHIIAKPKTGQHAEEILKAYAEL